LVDPHLGSVFDPRWPRGQSVYLRPLGTTTIGGWNGCC
jgi:hypothetical protein